MGSVDEHKEYEEHEEYRDSFFIAAVFRVFLVFFPEAVIGGLFRIGICVLSTGARPLRRMG